MGHGFINTERWIETVHRSLSQTGGADRKTGAAPRLFDRERRGWRLTLPPLTLAD